MAAVLGGHWTWELSRDEDGHRDYKIVWQVIAAVNDGPQTVMLVPGLPAIGSTWAFGADSDPWAFCWPTLKVTPRVTREPNKVWDLEQLFTTRPLKRCQDESIEDPLLEPQKVSGSFVKYTREAVRDRFGNLIKSSSHEMLRGPQVEFDHNRPTVKIEQNVASLGLATFTSLVDSVNDAPLWGLGARRIKLSNVSWERKIFGLCSYYYTRGFEFDIDFNTFDRVLLDEGTKVLHGHWEGDAWVLDDIDGSPPDPSNPQHFDRYKDRNGENARVILDGEGEPISAYEGPGDVSVEYYPSADFLLLGIPTSF